MKKSWIACPSKSYLLIGEGHVMHSHAVGPSIKKYENWLISYGLLPLSAYMGYIEMTSTMSLVWWRSLAHTSAITGAHVLISLLMGVALASTFDSLYMFLPWCPTAVLKCPTVTNSCRTIVLSIMKNVRLSKAGTGQMSDQEFLLGKTLVDMRNMI